MLELRHISKTFYPGTVHEKTALQDLSLTLQTGDFVTILGSNGAGKSTLFNAVAGGFAVDSGRIVLDGQELTGMPDYKRSKFIGRMFQDPMRGTAPNMTIEENLALAFLRTNGKSSPFSVITRADRAAFREKLVRNQVAHVLQKKRAAARKPGHCGAHVTRSLEGGKPLALAQRPMARDAAGALSPEGLHRCQVHAGAVVPEAQGLGVGALAARGGADDERHRHFPASKCS